MKVVLIAFAVLWSFAGFGQVDTLIVEDLSAGWLSFDKEGNTVPYQSGKSEVVFFELPTVVDGETYLLISCQTKFDLWINDQLIAEGMEGSKSFLVDSLLSAHLKTPNITLYASEWKEYQLSTSFYKLSPTKNRNRYTRITHKGFLSPDVYLICLILTLGFAGIYRKYFQSSFAKVYQSPLSFKLRGLSAEDAYLSFASIDNIYSIFYFSFIGAWLISYLGYKPIEGVSNPSWVLSIGSLLLLSLLIGLFVLGKYFLSLIIARIFDFKAIPNIQTQDYIHFSMLVITCGLGLSLVDFALYNFTASDIKWFVVIIMVIAMIFFQVWLLLKLDKFYSHRKLMIIAYLCTTEFLPGFLIVYWLVKS